MKNRWEISEQYKCPRCKKPTEEFIEFDTENNGMMMAERCPRCHWEIDVRNEPRKVPYGTNVA